MGPAPIPIVAVVFHVDGVLIDSEPLWCRVERERLGTVSVDLTADDLVQTMGVPIHEVVGVWHRRHPWREPTPGELAEDIRGKPDPAIYVSAARELGVAPERCLAVEDSVNGVRSVKGAGMVCVAIPEAPPADGTCDGAYLVLGSLHDLNGGIWPGTGTTPTAPRR